jgi:hypothetical protein
MIMIPEDDRDRIEAEARWKAETTADIKALKDKVALMLRGLGIAATALGLSILDKISGGIFK